MGTLSQPTLSRTHVGSGFQFWQLETLQLHTMKSLQIDLQPTIRGLHSDSIVGISSARILVNSIVGISASKPDIGTAVDRRLDSAPLQRNDSRCYRELFVSRGVKRFHGPPADSRGRDCGKFVPIAIPSRTQRCP